MIAKLIAAAVLWWLFKPGADRALTEDEIAEQYGGNSTPRPDPTGDVGCCEGWTARFNPETGEWSNDYRAKDRGDIP